MEKIRVLLAEDHTIVRKGIRSLLSSEQNIEVVGEARCGREAIEMVRKLRPDVVLMDISMPRLNGLEATRQIKKKFPRVKVLVLTVHANEEYVYQIMRAGASGYLVKQAAVEELIMAIQAAYRGGSFISPSISARVIEKYVRNVEVAQEKHLIFRLTAREREVLQLIAEGHTNKEIASLLDISTKTVDVHRDHLMKKMQVHNTAGLTRRAIGMGLISPDI